jgi:hypothetical protein
MTTKKGSCIACEGDLRFFGQRLNYDYYICSTCGTLQLFPMPNEKELREAYAKEYASSGHTEEFEDPERWRLVARTYHQSILNALVDHGISDLIIDYGAGWGHLCEMLIDYGFDCRGVEMSKDMVNYCQKKGLLVEHGDLEVLEKSHEEISAIVMCAVFEHLVNHHAWLTRVHGILSSNGFLVTLHPTAACYNLLGRLMRLGNLQRPLPELHGSFTPPWHTALFSIDATKMLAEKNGFELLEIRPAPQGRIGGFLGCVQVSLEIVNKVGWHLLGETWPLVTTHIFVMRKK